jgi:hypothetical protein
MNIFIAMVNDRHTEPEASLFSTYEKALAYAMAYLAEVNGQWNDGENGVDPDDKTMDAEALTATGWLFYERYSTEGDSIWILEAGVDVLRIAG